MYYSLAALAAVLISVMVAMNGGLMQAYGLHVSVLIIHAVGLIFTSAAAAFRKEKLFSVRGLPFWIFFGGTIGYLTTLFNNMAINKISITAILALNLLGQSVASLIIDQFGLLGMPIRKFNLSKLIGLAMVAAGISFLLADFSSAALVPVILSLLTGLTVVLSRTLNADLGSRTSVLVSTWYNYVTGLTVSAIALCLASAAGNNAMPETVIAAPLWAYFGGALGSVVVLMSNFCVRHISSFAMTLVMFAGQVFGGVAVDALMIGEFSWRSLAGGLFAFLGLILNVVLDRAQNRKTISDD